MGVGEFGGRRRWKRFQGKEEHFRVQKRFCLKFQVGV